MNPFKRFKHGIHIAPSYATDPIIGEVGDIYHNSVSNKLRYCISSLPTAIWTDLLIGQGVNDGAPLTWDASGLQWISSPNFTMLNNIIETGNEQPLLIKAASATTPNADGKNVELYAGLGNGSGIKGKILIDSTTVILDTASASDPVIGQQAELYYNTTLKQFKFHDGTTWRPMSGGAGLSKITAVDVLSISLPTGVSPVVDSYVVVDGDLVLFTNLTTGSNIVYRASDTLVSTTWTPEYLFAGSTTPTKGDSVMVQEGVGYAEQAGVYTGTDWEFSLKRRQLNGVDYYEESTVYAATILDNTTAALFSVNATGSEYLIIDYSVKRGSSREVGTLYMVHDGTNATVTGSNGSLTATGVYFSANINLGQLELIYTSDSAGIGGVFKFIVRRWSDAPGGPGGLPSYTGAPAPTAAAAGSVGNIQFSDGANLAASSSFNINTSDNAMEIGGRQLTPLSAPILLNDNQPTPSTFATYSAIWEFMEIEYSIERGTNRSRGRLLITNNGTDVNITDDFVELVPRQMIFSVSLLGGMVNVEYVSSPTGDAPSIRYCQSRWQ